MRTKTIIFIIITIVILAGVGIWAYQKYFTYPRVIGTDPETGLTLVEIYFCSDVCPEYGGTYIVFEGIKSKEQCAEIRGVDIIDAAWGGYIGCGPKSE